MKRALRRPFLRVKKDFLTIAVTLLPAASATSPPESYGFQGGAAGACAQAQRLRCVTCNENLRFSLRKEKTADC